VSHNTDNEVGKIRSQSHQILRGRTRLPIKALLFDLGDTLLHTEGFDYEACLWEMHQNLSQNGIVTPFEDFKRAYFEVRDRFYKEMDRTLKEQDFAERVTETLRYFGFELSSQDKRVHEAVEVFMNLFVESLRMDDYLPQLLEWLRKKYKMGIISNMSFAEAVPRTLRKFDIAHYFDAIIVSGFVGWRKPSPRIFNKALRALNVKAQQSVFIGDSPRADIEGAKKLGMKTVLVVEEDKKIPSTDTFRLYVDKGVGTGKPDKIIKELTQLQEALDNLEKEIS
jgi:putative hydrolase of the HAD superfamily